MDREYWNTYYKKKLPPNQPSQFAIDILEHLQEGKKLIELGCGNGRDAVFFGKNGINVVAIDQSEVAIEELQAEKHLNTTFVKSNFVNSHIFEKDAFDYVYSRFTLHAISEIEQEEVLKQVYKTLKNEGILFIEVRSVKDTLYGLGEQVGRNAYIYDEHYRRFLVLEELILSLKNNGFEILFAQEADNCAIYRDANPIVIRIHAKKVENMD